MGYTWAQTTAYLRLARQQRAADRRERLLDTFLAFAGGDGLKKQLQQLGDLAQD